MSSQSSAKAMSAKVQMPSIAFIVARSYPQSIIGCENRLPWRLKTDMKNFRSVTQHHAVIMGRKTFDSIGHPLPKRMNIVLSRNEGNNSSDLIWVKDRESALFLADYFSILWGRKQLIVIGGAEIYEKFEGLVNKVFLTEVFHEFADGDAFFRFSFDGRKWRTIEEEDYPASERDEYSFRISVLERRLAHVRQRDISEFMTKDPNLERWMTEMVSKGPPFDEVFREKVEAFEQLPEEQFSLPLRAA